MKIVISAQRDGFRRCGVAHSRAPVAHDADAFREEELAIMRADPMLKVEVVEDADAPAAPAPAEGGDEARIAAAIRELGPEGYTAAGKPDVGAVAAALGGGGPKVDAKIRDRVWKRLVEDGFSAPEAQ